MIKVVSAKRAPRAFGAHPKIGRLLAFILGVLISATCHSEIYRWVDEDGKVQFSDRPPDDAQSDVIDTSVVNSYTSVSYEKVTGLGIQTDRLIMYSAEWCGVCTRAKRYLASNGVNYVERDIDKSKSARTSYDKLGGSGVPIFIYGDKRMNGFSESGLENLLAVSE